MFSLLLCLCSCDRVVDKFLEGNSDSFKTSYKRSFIASCSKPEETQAKIEVCTCVADILVDKFSVKELRDEQAMIKYVQEVAIKECVAEE